MIRFLFFKVCVIFFYDYFIFIVVWVSFFVVFIYYLFFFFGIVISECYGCWVVVLFGILVCLIGLLSFFFVISFLMLYVIYSLLWGMGVFLVYFVDLLIFIKYFKVRFCFVNGIMVFGGVIGGSVFSLIM